MDESVEIVEDEAVPGGATGAADSSTGHNVMKIYLVA